MWKKLGFSLVTFVLFLVLTELIAQQFERTARENVVQSGVSSGWQERFFADVFDWHEPDPELLWRLKSNLSNPYIRTNSSHSIGDEITVPKPLDAYRILLLGDSSPLGLGLQSYDQSFGAQLPKLLQGSFELNRRIELINASVAGYSSEQIKRYLKMQGERLDPDLVILYCGANDASISGYCSDRELLDTQQLKWLREQLSRFALFRMVRTAVGAGRQATSSAGQGFKVRVPPTRFGENLADIAKQCHHLGCKLIVVKPPTPLMWPAGLQFKIFSSVTSPDGQLILPPALADKLNRPIRYCLDRDRMPAWYGDPDRFTRGVYASAYWDRLSPDSAIDYYREELEDDPTSPILLNNLGVAHWELGDHVIADRYLRAARQAYVEASVDLSTAVSQALGSVLLFNIGINLLAADETPTPEALTYLDSALQADYLSLRVKRTYLEQIDSVGDRYDHVTVVDMPTTFARNGGESLFIDHCHPTSEGHRLIALELFETIVSQ